MVAWSKLCHHGRWVPVDARALARSGFRLSEQSGGPRLHAEIGKRLLKGGGVARGRGGVNSKNPMKTSKLMGGRFLWIGLVSLWAGGHLTAGPLTPQEEIERYAPAARAILDAWHAEDPEPGERLLHIVLWTPSDKELAPRYRERLSGIMKDIREYYAREMDRLGFGRRTIGLDLEEDGMLRIHVVRGEGPYADYDVSSGHQIRNESLPVLREAGIDPDNETLVIFCNMSVWDEEELTIRQNSPYYAGGDHRRGNAWQVDSPILDIDLLDKNEPMVQDGQYGRISVGRYNSIFIGGIAHELGHALGLPHNLERADEREVFGTALMGSGNRTYGEERRGEGKGSFLTLAHGLRLASHPMFSGSVKGMHLPPSAVPEDLRVEETEYGFRVEGRVEAEPPVYAVVAYLDPAGHSDYNAVTAVTVPDADGRFVLHCRDLVPDRVAELRITFLQAHGAASGAMSSTPYRYPYRVDEDGRADLSVMRAGLMLEPLLAELRGRRPDVSAAAAMLQEREGEWDAKTHEVAARLIASFGEREFADEEAIRSDAALPLADLPPASEQVGWGNPVRDRVPDEALLMTGGARLFAHGIYAHAPARHEWQLDGSWEALTGYAGLAEGRAGSVQFEIHADGEKVWESDLVRQGTGPVPFEVPLQGVESLVLVVTDGGDGNSFDWGMWFEPTLRR